MAVVDSKDLLAEAESRFLEQLKDKDNFLKLVEVFTEAIQEVHDVLLDMLDLLNIDTQEGDQLDGIGSIVGEERLGRTDADYRIALKARIRINVSRGTIEDIYSLLALIVGDGVTIELEELQPATIQVHLNQPVIDPAVALAYMNEAKAAGIASQITYDEVAPTLAFELASVSDTLETGDTLKGLSNTAQDTGGYMSGVVG
jgi:hypothetical protein